MLHTDLLGGYGDNEVMEPIATLWERHKTGMRGYVAKRVGESDAIEDILQEVFVKAHSQLYGLKSPGSVAAWLFRIASNAIADHYRLKKLWIDLLDDLAAPQPERDQVAELATCLPHARPRFGWRRLGDRRVLQGGMLAKR